LAETIQLFMIWIPMKTLVIHFRWWAEITYERLNTFFQNITKKLPKKRKETSSQSDDSPQKQLLRYKNQIDKFTEDERYL
jgi:hypothetical protein